MRPTTDETWLTSHVTSVWLWLPRTQVTSEGRDQAVYRQWVCERLHGAAQQGLSSIIYMSDMFTSARWNADKLSHGFSGGISSKTNPLFTFVQNNREMSHGGEIIWDWSREASGCTLVVSLRQKRMLRNSSTWMNLMPLLGKSFSNSFYFIVILIDNL